MSNDRLSGEVRLEQRYECAVQSVREKLTPPRGPRLSRLKVQTEYRHDAENEVPPTVLSPLQVKFEELAKKWQGHLEHAWSYGAVEVFLQFEDQVFSVSASEGHVRSDSFRRHLKLPPTSAEELAWAVLRCFAQTEVNQFPRPSHWEKRSGRLCRQDLEANPNQKKQFLQTLDWLSNATSPDAKHRGNEDRVELVCSRQLSKLLYEQLQLEKGSTLSGVETERLVDAFNALLERTDFFDKTLIDRATNDNHLQVTLKLAKLLMLVSSSDLAVPEHDLLRLRRLWLEALTHNPDPSCSAEYYETGNQPLEPSICPLPMGPFVTDKTCFLPIHLWRPSRLLGMICLHGAAPESNRWTALAAVGDLVDAFILDAVRDNLLFFETAYRLKDSQSESQVGEVLQYMAENYFGANDNCIQFRDKTGTLHVCVQQNCQYQHADFGPGFGVKKKAGAVYDNIRNYSGLHNSDGPHGADAAARGRNGEIIRNLTEDQRHLEACEEFVKKHGLTFYDQSALIVLVMHAGNPGAMVLHHLPGSFYRNVDFVELDAILQLAAMRMDELVAEGYRAFLASQRSENLLNQTIYHELLSQLDGRGIVAFLREHLHSSFDVVVLMHSRPREESEPDHLRAGDRFASPNYDTLLDTPGFLSEVSRLSGNQNMVRAFWTGSDGAVWADQYYNGREPERIDQKGVQNLPPGRLAILAPLDVEAGAVLWLERKLTDEEAEWPEDTLAPNDWRKIEVGLIELVYAVNARWTATLNKNAELGGMARVLQHNLGHLMKDARFAVQDFEDRAESEGKLAVLDKLSFSEVKTTVHSLFEAFCGFTAIVRQTQFKERMVDDVCRLLAGQIRDECISEGIEVHIDLPDSESVMDVDMEQLAIALREILNNSKYWLAQEAAHGEIWFAAEVGDRLRISYEDSGPGIPAEKRQSVFRSDTSDKAGGTGLGLFLLRKIVEAHRGEVSAAEPVQETGGARFIIELPVRSTEETNSEDCDG